MKPSRRYIVLLVVSSSIFFEALDIAIVNLAMPLIQNDFNLTGDTVQWMQTLYVIFYGGFMILGGKMADVLGRKLIFMIGSALFLATSFGAAVAGSFEWLCFFRAFQGLGAALVMPASMSIVTNTFTEPQERGKAIGIFGSFAAIGSGSGLSLGGILATYAGWQSVFYINVPVITLALLLGAIYITPDERKTQRQYFDVVSGIVLTMSLLILTYLIHELNHATEMPFIFGVGVVLVIICSIVFLRRGKKPNALIDFNILNTRGTITGNIVMIMMGAFFTGFLFLISIVLQSYMNFTAAQSGLLLLPFSILSAIVSKSFIPRLLKVISISHVAVLGMLLMTAGGVSLIMAVVLDYPLITVLLAAAFVTGTGIAVCFSSMIVICMQDVPEVQHGLAASFANTCFFLGGGLGLSLLGLMMQLEKSNHPVLTMVVLTCYAFVGVVWLISRKRTPAVSTAG